MPLASSTASCERAGPFALKAYPKETVSVQNEAAEAPVPKPQTSVAAECRPGNRKSDFLKN